MKVSKRNYALHFIAQLASQRICEVRRKGVNSLGPKLISLMRNKV